MLGTQSETGAIGRLFLKHAQDAFGNDGAIAREWKDLNYTAAPVLNSAIAEYNRFVGALREFGIELEFFPSDDSVGLDSIYVRDASVTCPRGIILCNMGKAARVAEPAAQEVAFDERNLPVVGRIRGDGRLEGGDVVWLSDRLVAVGRGYRTNDEGIRQFQELVRDDDVEVVVVALPHWRGPSDLFHLMSILSPVDRDLALVCSPLMPIPFRERLIALGYELVEVLMQELETLGCNVLAVAPRTCLMVSGNPRTRERLENVGVEVHEFDGQEICVKGGGGPTCLTRPLTRR